MEKTRFLTYIDPKIVENLGWTQIVQVNYVFEAVLLLMNLLEYIFVLYIFITIRAMHRNFHLLIFLYATQYLFSLFSRLYIIYHQYAASESFFENPLLFYANHIRTICLFIAFCVFPILVMERGFATCLAENYENNRHLWIPFVLISLMASISVFSGFGYIWKWFPILLFCILFLSINLGGCVVLMLITRCNMRLYRKYSNTENSFKQYSLTERFQISENLKTGQWLTRVRISIIFFNIGCVSILFIEHFTNNARIIIIAYISFNFSCVLYATIVPMVVIYYTPEWWKGTKVAWNKVTKKNINVHPDLRTTFGEEMVYADKNIESRVYFDRLQRDLTGHSKDKGAQNSKKKSVGEFQTNSNHSATNININVP